MLRTSQLADSRMTPTSKPEQRRGDDAHGRDQQRVEHTDQQRPAIGVADSHGIRLERDVEVGGPGQEVEAEGRDAAARGSRRHCEPRYQATATTSASSSHCAARRACGTVA